MQPQRAAAAVPFSAARAECIAWRRAAARSGELTRASMQGETLFDCDCALPLLVSGACAVLTHYTHNRGTTHNNSFSPHACPTQHVVPAEVAQDVSQQRLKQVHLPEDVLGSLDAYFEGVRDGGGGGGGVRRAGARASQHTT
jgi:hypothetical protein